MAGTNQALLKTEAESFDLHLDGRASVESVHESRFFAQAILLASGRCERGGEIRKLGLICPDAQIGWNRLFLKCSQGLYIGRLELESPVQKEPLNG